MALKEIVEYKKAQVALKKDKILSGKNKIILSERSLLDELNKPGCSFICEIKMASPSEGVINKNANIDHIARIYAEHAGAISVLADEKYFGGSQEFVAQVSISQNLPVLYKDIIVSPLQIIEARTFGADAILLMLSVLSDNEYIEYARLAQEFRLDVICEVYSEHELERAKNLQPKIIGINNRDLKTLQINFDNTAKLLSKIWPGVAIISESGFYTHEQVKRYRDQVQAILVGTSLMKAKRTDLALRELIFGRVKICGLTNQRDAHDAYACGAYYGGLNFSKNSRRFVTVDEAKIIKEGVPLVWGGVFVEHEVLEISQIARILKLDFVQLHGFQDEKFRDVLRKNLPASCEIWQAVPVIKNLKKPVYYNADMILYDSFKQKNFGGSGHMFDWNILKDFPADTKFILAGGINYENIDLASSTGAFVLDIASGSEDQDPRKKSLSLMKNLFARLRGI